MAIAALHGDSWICNACAGVSPSRLNTFAQPRHEISEPVNRTSERMLRMLQCNAQLQELFDRLATESISVCLIRETKFSENCHSQSTTASDLAAPPPTVEGPCSPWLKMGIVFHVPLKATARFWKDSPYKSRSPAKGGRQFTTCTRRP